MAGAELHWSHDTTLDAAPISASRARSFVCIHLVDYRLPYLVEPVRLVVSELVTNALVHGRTPLVVTLSRLNDTVRVTVSDGGGWVPHRVLDSGLQVGGRGLSIVDGFSDDWGIVTDDGSKAVWASFDVQKSLS